MTKNLVANMNSEINLPEAKKLQQKRVIVVRIKQKTA